MSKKKKEAKPAGKCIFCGKQGDLTKQHVWSDFLKNSIPRSAPGLVTKRFTSQIHLSRDNSVIEPEPIKWNGHLFTKTIRNVCLDCNNLWLNPLEQKLKPILESLIYGNKEHLNKEEYEALCHWITVMVIMAEFMDLKNKIISPEEVREFYKSNRPLPNSQIWIGRYNGDFETPNYYHNGVLYKDRLKMLSDINTPVQRFQISTFTIGYLYIHFISYSEINQSFIPKNYFNKLVKIFPADVSVINLKIIKPFTVDDYSSITKELVDQGLKSTAIAYNYLSEIPDALILFEDCNQINLSRLPPPLRDEVSLIMVNLKAVKMVVVIEIQSEWIAYLTEKGLKARNKLYYNKY